MANIPVRFKQVAAAFDEMARVCSCESSGSEHSAAATDLSDLVNSFLEREISDRRRSEEVDGDSGSAGEINDHDEIEIDSQDRVDQVRDSLTKLFDLERDAAKRSVHAEVEAALEEVDGIERSSPEFKRRLMARLRGRGFDAGLCKSKWEKDGRNPSGNYEYIDVNSSGNRYIIEVHLAGEFTIARPTDHYAYLLENFPSIFVGEPDELKKVIRIMGKAIRKSMKSVDLTVPPWRRLRYMQARWFGFYRRTVNEALARKACESSAENRLVGFAPATNANANTRSLYCRGDFGARSLVRAVGNLAAALN